MEIKPNTNLKRLTKLMNFARWAKTENPRETSKYAQIFIYDRTTHFKDKSLS